MDAIGQGFSSELSPFNLNEVNCIYFDIITKTVTVFDKKLQENHVTFEYPNEESTIVGRNMTQVSLLNNEVRNRNNNKWLGFDSITGQTLLFNINKIKCVIFSRQENEMRVRSEDFWFYLDSRSLADPTVVAANLAAAMKECQDTALSGARPSQIPAAGPFVFRLTSFEEDAAAIAAAKPAAAPPAGNQGQTDIEQVASKRKADDNI